MNLRKPITLSLIFVCFFFVELSAAAAPPEGAPSVVIQKRRVVIYRRGKFVRDFPERRRATVNYPVVMGPRNSEVLNKIRSTLELKNVFDTSLVEYRADTWLDELDYKVNYNRNYLLDITFTQSGMGAYPDVHTKHFIINLRNGEALRATDVFDSSSLNTLAALVDKKLQAETREILRDSGEDKEQAAELFREVKFGTTNLDEFSVNDRGVTFLYDAGFPHAVQALEPVGNYFFSYAELKPYIKRDGPLGVFVK